MSGPDLELEDIQRTFLAEVSEGLATMEEALLGLEAHPDDAERIASVFRVVHTLKGNADSLGLEAVTEIAHALEDVLDGLRRGVLRARPALVTLLLQAVDALRVAVPDAVAGAGPATGGALVRRLRRIGAAVERRAAGGPAPRVERRASAGRRADDSRGDEGTLRVSVATLDRLLGLAGEITVARGRLSALLQERGAAGHRALDAHRDAERLFLELQDLVMRARMVPLAPVFRQQARAVRDLAAAHGKLARLVVEGGDVEVDTAVIEHVRDPLTHLVRNAIGHGLEAPAARRAAGKDPCGTVTLRAAREGATIVVHVADDGGGLDRARILERARAAGLLSAHDKPSHADVDALIFEPGFSTASAVTSTAGRGVGLDVVRRNAEHLRGTVTVESRPGEGTTVSLRLPLRIAIVEGFALEVAGDTWVLPLDVVEECLPVSAADAPPGAARGMLDVRGAPVPWVRLREVLGPGGAPDAREEAVVVRHGAQRAAFLADALHGESQTVLKPLGPLLRGVACGPTAGAIQGDGRVALVLDVGAVLRRATAAPPPRAQEGERR